MTLKLGVNIDHVATLRQARGTSYPSPVHAALLAEDSGADSITLHLREDRRHIRDADVRALRGMLATRMNLEMAVTEEMLGIACEVLPQDVCLVPERRQEVTTEGGLDVAGQFDKIQVACATLTQHGIRVSLFVDTDPHQIEAARQTGAPVIEIHTGRYAEAKGKEVDQELKRIIRGVELGQSLGLAVNAGHGLHYHNVQPIAAIRGVEELNIGHAIISHAIFSGLDKAIREMRRLMKAARRPSK